jgi:hypothetical protein
MSALGGARHEVDDLATGLARGVVRTGFADEERHVRGLDQSNVIEERFCRTSTPTGQT